MKYEISKATAPAMPNLGKGTEIVKLLLSQASKDMYEPLVPMFFPIFGAHISVLNFNTRFRYAHNNSGLCSHNETLMRDNAALLRA